MSQCDLISGMSPNMQGELGYQADLWCILGRLLLLGLDDLLLLLPAVILDPLLLQEPPGPPRRMAAWRIRVMPAGGGRLHGGSFLLDDLLQCGRFGVGVPSAEHFAGGCMGSMAVRGATAELQGIPRIAYYDGSHRYLKAGKERDASMGAP